MIEDIADEQDAKYSGLASTLVYSGFPLPQTSPRISRATGKRPIRRVPMMLMIKPRILRASVREVRNRLQKLRLRWLTSVLEYRDAQTANCSEQQKDLQCVDKEAVFDRNLLSQEDASLRLKVEDSSESDASADHGQWDQVILQVVLRQARVFLGENRRKDRDWCESQLLQHAGGVQQPD